jgi:translation initiation factor 4G
MYARLCREMELRITTTEVQHDGNLVAGGRLFRTYLSSCHDEIDRGWDTTDALLAVAETTKVKVAMVTHDNNVRVPALYMNEYYAVQKAKRRGLGVTKLVGELYMLGIWSFDIPEALNEPIGGHSTDAGIESMCQVLAIIGQHSDVVDARGRSPFDPYFSRMKTTVKSPKIRTRPLFALQVWISGSFVAV